MCNSRLFAFSHGPLSAGLLTSLLLLGFVSPVRAQTTNPRDELLRFVPKDFGLCLAIHDLRGQVERWQASNWVKSVWASPLGQAFLKAPEIQQLHKFQNDLQKHLGIDWATLRDDVLGDAVVFAYQPGAAGKPDDEQGILLVHARKADVLARLVERVNQAQKESGELKELEAREYKGTTYYRRAQAPKTHFYLLKGPFLAYTGKEDLVRWIIDQKGQKGPAPIAQQLRKAGADKALATLWVNPRVFEGEIIQKLERNTGPQGPGLKFFLDNWRCLEAVVVSVAADDFLELRLTLQARAKDLAPALGRLFNQPARPSELWGRFPDNALFSLAGRLDLADLGDSLADLAPADVHKKMQGIAQPAAAFLGLDLKKEVLPSLGPDWGLCILPPAGAKEIPQVLAALAVKPGPKDAPVDQALFKGMQFLAGLAILDYNSKHPDPIRMRTLMQDKVEVKYLAQDKVFPAGFQPAWALKDGYLVLATSPDAIRRFRAGTATPPAGPDVPFLRVSATEVAKFLRGRRDQVIDQIAAKNQIAKAAAAQGLDGALSLLDLFDRLEMSQRSGVGQFAWTLRLYPAKVKP